MVVNKDSDRHTPQGMAGEKNGEIYSTHVENNSRIAQYKSQGGRFEQWAQTSVTVWLIQIKSVRPRLGRPTGGQVTLAVLPSHMASHATYHIRPLQIEYDRKVNV